MNELLSRNAIVKTIAIVALVIVFLITTLMSNFVGASTIEGLALQVALLVIVYHLLVHGLKRD